MPFSVCAHIQAHTEIIKEFTTLLWTPIRLPTLLTLINRIKFFVFHSFKYQYYLFIFFCCHFCKTYTRYAFPLLNLCDAYAIAFFSPSQIPIFYAVRLALFVFLFIFFLLLFFSFSLIVVIIQNSFNLLN